MNTCDNKEMLLFGLSERMDDWMLNKSGFLTPEYPEMSSKYLNLAVRLFTAALSSVAPLSAFLSFFSFDFFSLKLMLWGT